MEYKYYEEITENDALTGIMHLHEHVFEGAQLNLGKLTEKKNLLACVSYT